MFFDSAGVPSSGGTVRDYGSEEERQPPTTVAWIEKIAEMLQFIDNASQ
jgi:hypothetical protein